MRNKIYFRVDGDHGHKYGLGHIWRCLKLYNSLKKTMVTYDIIFLTKNTPEGIKTLKKEFAGKIIIYNKNNKKNLDLKSNDILIADTLGIEKDLLKLCLEKKLKKIVSFDEVSTKFFISGSIINGIFFSKKKLYTKLKNLKIFQHPKYIVLDKKFSQRKKFKKIKFNFNILITSGGSDKKEFLYKVCSQLRDVKNIKLTVIIGKGVKRNNPIFKFKRHRKIKLLSDTKDIYSNLKKSDIAIVSGGTVMFEAISSGKITFVCQTYENQKYAINYFRKKKIINYLGKVQNIRKKNLRTLTSFNNIKRINTIFLFKKQISQIDGKGLLKVQKIIKKYK